MRLLDWDDPRLRRYEDVVKDWYRPGEVKVIGKVTVKLLLFLSDRVRFSLLKSARLVDRWSWTSGRK